MRDRLHPLAHVVLAVFLLHPTAAQQPRRYLYVAVPGTESEAEYRGQPGILVFDVDDGHKFIRRIPTWPSAPDGQIESVRGIAADAKSGRLYVSTVKRLAAIDLMPAEFIWDKSYDGACCARFAVAPDGETIYAPAFGKPRWYVVRAANGDLVTTVGVMGWPRQTIYAHDG